MLNLSPYLRKVQVTELTEGVGISANIWQVHAMFIPIMREQSKRYVKHGRNA